MKTSLHHELPLVWPPFNCECAAAVIECARDIIQPLDMALSIPAAPRTLSAARGGYVSSLLQHTSEHAMLVYMHVDERISISASSVPARLHYATTLWLNCMASAILLCKGFHYWFDTPLSFLYTLGDNYTHMAVPLMLHGFCGTRLIYCTVLGGCCGN